MGGLRDGGGRGGKRRTDFRLRGGGARGGEAEFAELVFGFGGEGVEAGFGGLQCESWLSVQLGRKRRRELVRTMMSGLLSDRKGACFLWGY